MCKILAKPTEFHNNNASTAPLDAIQSEAQIECDEEESLFLKPNPVWKPATFAAVILEKSRIGRPDELAFLPVCSVCGKVILDPGNANIEVPDSELIHEGKIADVPIGRLAGNVYAFHLGCCPQRLMGLWKRLNTVIRIDQRYEGEKRSYG